MLIAGYDDFALRRFWSNRHRFARLGPRKMANDDLAGNHHRAMTILFKVTMKTSQAAIFLVVSS